MLSLLNVTLFHRKIPPELAVKVEAVRKSVCVGCNKSCAPLVTFLGSYELKYRPRRPEDNILAREKFAWRKPEVICAHRSSSCLEFGLWVQLLQRCHSMVGVSTTLRIGNMFVDQVGNVIRYRMNSDGDWDLQDVLSAEEANDWKDDEKVYALLFEHFQRAKLELSLHSN